MSELTCGACRHFRPHPRRSMDLSQPQQGDCREGPPTATSLPQGPQVILLCNFPVVHEQHPACSRHQAKPVEIAT
jgi:hypothetical protein